MNAFVQSNNSTASSSSALHFSQVATLLLAVVPMNSLLKVSDTVMADIDDEEEEQPEASTSDYSSGTVAVTRQRSYGCNAACVCINPLCCGITDCPDALCDANPL